MVGPGRPLDTERYFIICSNVIGGCMGSTGPASTQSGHRQGLGAGFSGHHHPRHGARAGHADRSAAASRRCSAWSADRWAAWQVLQWTAAYPERVFSALPVACSTRHSAQNIAFHELGRQAVMADPDWHHGRYFERQHAIRIAGWPWRGWPGTSPISRTPRCIASSAAGCRIASCRPSRSTPTSRSRAICAIKARPSSSASMPTAYLYLTRAMDYFDIAADHDGVAGRRRFAASRPAFCVVSLHQRLAVSDLGIAALVHALNASSARVSFAEIETDKGHDAFLLDVPEFFDIVRAFLRLRRQGARACGNAGALSHERCRTDIAGLAGRGAGSHVHAYRTDHLLVAEMASRPAPRCSTSAAATANLLQLLESRGIDGRGIELSREGVNRCVAKGLAVVQGDADTDLVNYPDDAFDYVILSQTLQATRQPKRRAGKSAAHRPARRRVVPEFRLLEDAAAIAGRRPHAAHRKSALPPGTTRRTSISAPSRISCSSATRSTSRWSAPSRSTSTAARCR